LAEPSAKAKNKFTAKAMEILARPPSSEREQAYRSLACGFMAQHRQWSRVESWTKLRRFVVEAERRPELLRLQKAVRYFLSNP
jgi:hypothetical protein